MYVCMYVCMYVWSWWQWQGLAPCDDAGTLNRKKSFFWLKMVIFFILRTQSETSSVKLGPINCMPQPSVRNYYFVRQSRSGFFKRSKSWNFWSVLNGKMSVFTHFSWVVSPRRVASADPKSCCSLFGSQTNSIHALALEPASWGFRPTSWKSWNLTSFFPLFFANAQSLFRFPEK